LAINNLPNQDKIILSMKQPKLSYACPCKFVVLVLITCTALLIPNHAGKYPCHAPQSKLMRKWKIRVNPLPHTGSKFMIVKFSH